jgi:ribosome-associated protein
LQISRAVRWTCRSWWAQIARRSQHPSHDEREDPLSRGPQEPQLDAYGRARVAARAAADKKALDTVILDVGDILGIADVFVITSGTNSRQVRTICDEVEEALKLEASVAPRSVEGLRDGTWILLDYGDVVVHVFLDETRQFYGLERLWADAASVEWEPPEAASV